MSSCVLKSSNGRRDGPVKRWTEIDFNTGKLKNSSEISL